jgi:hypothetical protein
MTEYDTVGLILICSDAAVLFGEKQKYVFHVPLIRHTKSHWSKTQILQPSNLSFFQDCWQEELQRKLYLLKQKLKIISSYKNT